MSLRLGFIFGALGLLVPSCGDGRGEPKNAASAGETEETSTGSASSTSEMTGSESVGPLSMTDSSTSMTPTGGSESSGDGTGGETSTDCEVHWHDPLGYTKPTCHAVPVPDEDDVTNKYYVDFSTGRGTSCTQSEPCGSLHEVVGQPGTAGGPATVYVKGQGRLLLDDVEFYGALGAEVVVRPWPEESAPVLLTAAPGCSVSDANIITGERIHHVVFDGGPDMLLRFVGSGCTEDQNGYTLAINSNEITLWRVLIDANDSAGPALGVATGIGGSADLSSFRMVNSEIFGATRYYGVYSGGGAQCDSGTTSHTNIEFRNSIFRDIDGRGIQIEPRADSSGVVIDGNAFHRIGYNESGTSSISSAVVVADACFGTTRDVVVSNNLMWDLGGGGVQIFVGVEDDEAFQVINNTIWSYANQTPVTLNSHGITCATDGCNGTVRNNIILAPGNGGLNPINRGSGLAAYTNLCEAGAVCGENEISAQVGEAMLSTNEEDEYFLFPSGAALGATSVQPGVDVDYLGQERVEPIDVGAVEQ